jgi:hypothetical protein
VGRTAHRGRAVLVDREHEVGEGREEGILLFWKESFEGAGRSIALLRRGPRKNEGQCLRLCCLCCSSPSLRDAGALVVKAAFSRKREVVKTSMYWEEREEERESRSRE